MTYIVEKETGLLIAEAGSAQEAEKMIRQIEADDFMERCYVPGRYEAWEGAEE